MAASSQLSRRRSTFLLQMAEAADRERGERIKELRGHKPQPVMADAVGVSLRAYQEWEAGGGIRWENIKALAKVHGVDPNFILSGPQDATPDLMGGLNGDGDLSQVAARLQAIETEQRHIRRAIEELVSWSRQGPTRKNLVERIDALTELIAPVVAAQESPLERELSESTPPASRRRKRAASGR